MLPPDENEQFHLLAQRIVPGSRLLRTWQLAGGISARMDALELRAPDGRTQRVIVRRPGEPHAAAGEYRVLQLTQALGLPTQAPLLLDQSHTILPTPYLVLEYIDGEPRFSFPDLRDAMRQLATQLARIHRAAYAGYDVSFLAQQTHDATTTFGARPTTPDRSLDEGRIRDTLEAAWPLPRRNAPALLHGDYWPGNILWRDGRLAAVIDWEDAMLGDPLIELAIARLDCIWIFGPAAMEAFTEQYRSRMPIDDSELPYWDLVAALRLIRLAGADMAGWAAFFEPWGRPDITEQTIRAHYHLFVQQAFEKLMV